MSKEGTGPMIELHIEVDELPDEAAQKAVQAWAEAFDRTLHSCITAAAIEAKANSIIPMTTGVFIMAALLDAHRRRIQQAAKAAQATGHRRANGEVLQ